MKLAGFVLALVAGGSEPLQSQGTGSVRGVVLDAVTRAPLAQVLVTIVDRPDSATTRADGSYRFDAIVPGTIRLTARKVGFFALTTGSYTVETGAAVIVDLKLAPLAVDLEAVRVEAEPSVRRAAIGAQVLRGDELPRGDIIAALRATVPSLRTSGRRDDVRARLRQSSSEVLYVIDGVVITPPLTFSIDSREVDCVEVRPGYQAAQEFRLSVNSEVYSGVVLIWTRGTRAPRPRECARS